MTFVGFCVLANAACCVINIWVGNRKAAVFSGSVTAVLFLMMWQGAVS